MPGVLGQLLVFFLHTIPSVLVWVIGFATITVPTWLFTLFSMSLTFTMNFTTMYVSHSALSDPCLAEVYEEYFMKSTDVTD